MTVINMDCLVGMRSMPDNSVDSVVTDPPYGIRFMGSAWDGADIDARAAARRSSTSHDPNGGHKSLAAEAGKCGLAPAAMRAFQEFSEEWAREAFRVLKPGGHLLSFSSARTYHRMVCGIEDAGFEIRDRILYVTGDGSVEEHFPAWVFGSGFPKSRDVSKAIDAEAGAVREVTGSKLGRPGYSLSNGAAGGVAMQGNVDGSLRNGIGECSITAPATDAARQWGGWGTALKPAHEPICVARKPFAKGLTVAANVLAHGTGAINVDGCRVGAESTRRTRTAGDFGQMNDDGWTPKPGENGSDAGRWPANLIHDGSDEVRASFPNAPGPMADESRLAPSAKTSNVYGPMTRQGEASQNNGNTGDVGFKMKPGARRADTGSAARFFYCAKASKKDRGAGNIHPTVKPTALMRYLCRLVTPPGGIVLDPFAGSGSTGKAAKLEGFLFMGFELDAGYAAIANARIEAA